MNAQSLETQIRSKLPSLPTKARRVADYILGNSSKAAFQSITEVAEALEVSKAQLVRVARLLGFDGYAGLKDAMRQEVLNQVAPSTTSIEMKEDAHIPKEL